MGRDGNFGTAGVHHRPLLGKWRTTIYMTAQGGQLRVQRLPRTTDSSTDIRSACRGAVNTTRTFLIALEADPRLLLEFESSRPQ